MTGEADVPTIAEVWDFLVGFKEATEAGFNRLTSDISRLASDVGVLRADVTVLKSDVAFLKDGFARMGSDFQRMERRLVRMDDRLSSFESLNVSLRLDDHEQRISRLEQHFS